MAKHYIAMAGLHGCMPNYCAAHTTKRAAIEDLIALHDLPRYGRVYRGLRSRGNVFVMLDLASAGNEYAEIAVCECDDLESHND